MTTSTLLRSFTAVGLTLVASLARAQDPDPVTTKITAVAVYADRAQVTRTGSVELAPGGSRVAVRGLPGWIDEESVRVTLASASAKIRDVSIERTFLAEATEEAVRKAEDDVRQITDQLAALNDEQAVLQAELTQVEALRAFSLEKVPRDMVVREVKVKSFEETVDFVSARVRKARDAMRAIAKKRRELEPELQRRQKAQQELRSRAQLEQRAVIVEVEGQGRTTIQVTYLTPGATWEPVGELRAEGDKSMSLVQYASIVQTTGEDWEGAALSFSTQRPTDTLAVPEAQALLVGQDGPGLDQVISRAGQSFQKAQSSYSTQNQVFADVDDEYRQNLERQRTMEQRVLQKFEELRERGTTAHFVATGSRIVRTDGRPTRVPLGTRQFAVTLKQVAVPEVSLNVVRTAELVNDTEQPILPGRVALFADGAFVGASELPFVSPGETFSTFLGVNERVKLARTIDRKKSSLERKGKRNILKVSFIVSAENLGDAPVTLDMADRTPVSADEAIEIEDVVLPDGAKRDHTGVVKWRPTIGAKKKVTWRVGYTIEYPADQAERAKHKSPAAPAPSRMLFEDIDRLERQF